METFMHSDTYVSDINFTANEAVKSEECKIDNENVIKDDIQKVESQKLPCISVMFVGENKYRCRICNVNTCSELHLMQHVKGKQHVAAQKKYGCENISLKEDSLYYCRCCESRLLSCTLACEHIKTKEHMNNTRFFSIFDMLVNIKNYHCTICDMKSSGEIDLQNHLKGKNHADAQKKYVHDNISLKDENLYYCGCCDTTLSSSKHVCEHIKEEKHMCNANIPCIFVMWVDVKKYFCRICKLNLSGEIKLQNHVKEKQHLDAQTKYGCENISRKGGNLYYCECCDCTLSSRKLAFSHITEKKHMNKANLPCISIMPTENNKYHCKICGVNSSGEIDLKNHVNGKQHSAAQKKHGSQNISRKEGNLYYCECCDCTLSSRKLASNHITEEKHMIKANLPCISIMPTENNKYHCKICGVNSSGEIDLKNHVNGKQHSAAQKIHGCENISRKEGNLYYCECCDCTLSSRKLASNHITEEKHMIKANLPCISIMPTENNKYHCKICGVNSSGEIDLKNHVNGKQHSAAQKKHGCQNISRKVGNLYYCECCDCTLSSRKLASNHITEEKHMIKANLPCISIMPTENNKYHCKICGVNSSGEIDLKNHVNGKQHSAAQKIHGCENISRKEGNLYYCECCDCTLSSRKLASNHITEEKHMIKANLPCISIMPTENNKYHCKICGVNSSGEIDLKNHVNGKQHSAAQKKHGCQNISRKEGDQYYCECCDCTLSSRKLASNHITEEKHMFKANLPCISIMPTENNKYHCKICGVNSSTEIDLKNHVNGKQHSAAQKKHGCQNISRKEGNLYYCECCDCTLSSRKLASNHITEEKHMIKANLPCISIMPTENNKYHCKICGVNSSTEIDLKNHVNGKQHSAAQKKHGCQNISRKEGNLYYCECCDCTLSSRKLASNHITEEKHMFKANLPCISIMPTENNKYHCKICGVNSSTEIDLKNHVNGKQHSAAQKKHGCQNISRKEGNLYYCECCDCTLSSRKLASNHITEEKHMIKANLPCISIMPTENNKYHCKICGVNSSGEIDLKNHVNGKQHSAAQKKHGCQNISRKEGSLYYCECCNCTLSSRKLASIHITEEKHMFKANLPCISIMPMKNNKYHCKICGVNSSGEIDLKNHVNGKQHSAAQKKHGCQNISRKEGNQYYCECCDCTLSSRKLASNHITEEKHMFKANLPCISIMPMKNNKYHCKICDVKSSNEIDLKNHVNGKQHSTAQKKHGCKNISLINGNMHYCVCCELSLRSRKLASEHITEEKHMSNANLPCISIMMVEKNKYHCRICNITSFGKKDLKIHVKDRIHLAAQKKYGCDNISLNEDNLYNCRCCDSTLLSRTLAFEHIKQTHMINKNILPCISVVSVDTSNYHCKICDITIVGESSLENHVKGSNHTAAKNKYGCDEIALREDNLYYCKIAYDHIKLEKHINTLKLSNKQEQTTITEIPKKAESIKRFESIAESLCQQSLGSYILKQDAANSYCTICDCLISDNRNVNVHVTDLRHVKLLKKFFVHSIYVKVRGSYYCGYCSCDIIGYDNVQSHIAGIAHANSRSMKKLAVGNQEQRSREKITVELKTKQPDDVSAAISQTLFDNFIVKVEKDLYCRVCECKITDHTKVNDHVTKNEHTSGLKKFHENQITINDNKYYCKCCNCNVPSCWHVDQHIIGKRHIGFLKVFNQGTKLTKQSNGKEENVVEKRNLKTVIYSLNTERSKLEKTLGLKITRKAKTVKMLRFKKTIVNKIFSSEKGEMRCSVCNASVEGAKNLHIHMARHFNNDFITCNEEKKMEKAIGMESLQIEQNNVTKTEGTSRFEHTDNVNCKEKAFCKRTEKKMNMKKIKKDLDFNENDIYSMEDKTADIELGMKLSFIIEKDIIYCLVCQKIISTSIQDYYEHLCSVDHCEYLDRMEKDHELFDLYPDQFSQLKLALQYMEEITNDVVRCLACDQEMDNRDIALQEHIDDKDHNQKCVKLNTKAKENFKNVKLMHCDWYQVQSYWCVPCIVTFRLEVNFAKHLKSEIHANNVKLKQNAKRKFMLDFCASCALLWYGYRCTGSYHCGVPSHIWLTREQHYTSTEIPISVASLLAKPEDYINKTIEYLDDVSTKEREKERILIHDLEKSVKTKFIHAKAYTFGSRVSGLGSPGCDIDVFLDCGNMYNGKSSSLDRILNFITDVHECLMKEPEAWDIEELLTMCRSPIIKAHHRVTGLSCDISFENGLAVENTLLIKSFNDIFPSCRKIILILKQWLNLCKLSGSERITSYALYWIVIFYLQKESILPSIATLIAMKKRSQVIAGWDTGVSRDFTYNELEHKFSIKELLIRFFTFYANFDYRQDVACPLLGDVIAKRAFTDPQSLPKEMERYVANVNNSGESFRIDSVMCIQDPFDLQHNLSKALSKVYLNRFKKYCSKSLDVLCAF